MMRIPDSVIQEIYNRADILEVVGEYVQLKKRGANYWALSPFKTEKTPSFVVSPAKGIYKCFSTGKGGNVVNFLMEIEGFSYLEAIKRLAQKYHVALETQDEQPTESYEKAESLRILHKFACQYFQDQLHNSAEGKTIALPYFQKRGIKLETLRVFQLGYAKQGFQEFTQYALQAKYQENVLVESGLSIKSEKNGKLYDRFHGRIMFPLIDVWGKAIGFAGRLLQEAPDSPKYLNSPESLIYHKSKFLFGLHLAKTAIREQNLCFIVEGYMDMISLYQAGIRNVVAVSGTSLTQDHLQLLKRYTTSLILLFDGDLAGIKATQRAIALALENSMNLQVLPLPTGHDPDSFIQQNGKEAFLAFAKEKAVDFINFQFEIKKKELSQLDPFAKAAFIKELALLISRIADPLQRMLYIQAAAEKIKVPEEQILNSVEGIMRQSVSAHQKTNFAALERLAAQETGTSAGPMAPWVSSECWWQERELLRLWLLYGEETIEWEGASCRISDILYQNLHETAFETPVFEQIKNILAFEYEQNNPLDLHKIFNETMDKEILKTVTELQIQRYSLSENWLKRNILVPDLDTNLKACVENALDHFQLKKINQLHKENKDKMKEIAQNPDQFDELLKLLKRQQKIENIRKELAAKLGVVITAY
jgi:DNA primase